MGTLGPYLPISSEFAALLTAVGGIESQLLLIIDNLPSSEHDILQVCERLPMVEVTWRAPRLASGKESKPADEAAASSEQRYVLEVHLRRLSGPRGSTNTRAYTPRFPKVCPGHHFAHRSIEAVAQFTIPLLLKLVPLNDQSHKRVFIPKVTLMGVLFLSNGMHLPLLGVN